MNFSRTKLLPIVFFLFLGSALHAQCPFTFSFFGSGTAPAPGNSAVLQTCSFAGEAVTANGVVAGNTYCIDVSYAAPGGSLTPFVVVYDANFNPIASGFSPVSFTAPSAGTYYSIPFMDQFCTSFDPNFGCNSTLWGNISSGGTQTVSSCISYTWPFNNQVYTTSGIYVDSVLTVCGHVTASLDLTIVSNSLNYTVTNSNGTLTSNQNVGTYQWIDCQTNLIVSGATNQSFSPAQAGNYAVILTDSTGCTDTTNCFSTAVISGDTVVNCGAYTWPFNNQTYTMSGVYTDSVPTPIGYDYAFLDLTVLSFTPTDLSVVDSGSVLISQFSQQPSSYQWIDCATNLPINGATNQSFSPTQSGSYAVIVSDGVCSDTSACTTVQVSGLSLEAMINLSIKPNPTKDLLTISFEGEHVQLRITDTNGKLIYSNKAQTNEQIDLSSVEAGVYFFNIQTGQGNEIFRIIRQ